MLLLWRSNQLNTSVEPCGTGPSIWSTLVIVELESSTLTSGPHPQPPASALILFTATVLWTLRLISLVRPLEEHSVWWPHCPLQWVHLESRCHPDAPNDTPPSPQPDRTCSADSELQRKSLTESQQFVPVCQQPPAIKPALSAALSADRRHAAETPCPARAPPPRCTQEAGTARGPLCLAPEQTPALMSAGPQA